jgi:hypothetical protein
MESIFLLKKYTIRSMTVFLPALCILLATIGACGTIDGENTMAQTTIKEITYHFGDASVPPDYHRSYTITVTANRVKIVVDSYGDILADEEYEITAQQFDDIQRSLEKNNIENCTLGEDEGCTGGTSERISYVNDKNETFSGSVYHCGGKDTGNLCGDIGSFADAVKKLVPNVEELLDIRGEK